MLFYKMAMMDSLGIEQEIYFVGEEDGKLLQH